ncbi:MAG: hypothetical protein IMZ60_02565 [Actinobacteria bacterium]|nr:hypothetical protein [Actinomycetota bacterium]
MKTQIILIIALFFSIGIVSALDIFAGENVTIPLEFEIVNCSVTDSTYNLEGLNLSWSGKDIIFSTAPNYQSDNLTISCWVIKYREVVEEHYSGGGSSCTYNKAFNWQCSAWGECINGQQIRTCKKYNNCGNTYGKPKETQVCEVATVETNQTEVILTLLERVIQMREQGNTDDQIIEKLTQEGIPIEEINAILNPPRTDMLPDFISRHKWWFIILIPILLIVLLIIIQVSRSRQDLTTE